jgi:hypothetical protein
MESSSRCCRAWNCFKLFYESTTLRVCFLWHSHPISLHLTITTFHCFTLSIGLSQYEAKHWSKKRTRTKIMFIYSMRMYYVEDRQCISNDKPDPCNSRNRAVAYPATTEWENNIAQGHTGMPHRMLHACENYYRNKHLSTEQNVRDRSILLRKGLQTRIDDGKITTVNTGF